MSKKLKLSPWHYGDVNPVHVGVYERLYSDGKIWFCNWTGKVWMCAGIDVEDALNMRVESCEQTLKWRGILK